MYLRLKLFDGFALKKSIFLLKLKIPDALSATKVKIN